MASVAFTQALVDSVKVEVRTDLWDKTLRGLVLRVSPQGAKTWAVIYTDAERARQRATVGRYPVLGLAAARQKALQALAGIAEGNDPAGKKRAQREAETVLELGAVFIDEYSKPRKKSWREDERILRVEVYPCIGGMKANQVKRRDLLEIIKAKAEGGSLVQSTRILATVRKMFSWAVNEDRLEDNPALGLKPRGVTPTRDRVLEIDELAAIWRALDTAAVLPITRDVLRLLMLTGQRSGEVCGMTRGEINLDKRQWELPKERTKNGRPHIVPLSAAAMEIIGARLALIDGDARAPLFSRTGDAIEPNAVSGAARKALQVLGEQWQPHDLRRSVATGMAALGTFPHVIEAALNHISGAKASVAGIYNRFLYEPEKRVALEAWERNLIQSISGDLRTSNVVGLFNRSKT